MFSISRSALGAAAALALLQACNLKTASQKADTAAAEPTAPPVGQFSDHQDIGPVKIPGSFEYDSKSGTYTLRASGTNMWGEQDEFHYAFNRLRGDFIVRARLRFVGEGDENRKIGWTVRESLEPDAKHVNAALHGNGLIALQHRDSPGAETLQEIPDAKNTDVVQLERKGNSYILSAAKYGEPFVSVQVADIELGEAPYVGLSACAHNPDATVEAKFSNVRIIKPAPPGFQPYQDYIGSNIEVMNLRSGGRKIIYQAPDSVQAPNWTRDGTSLIYNRNGLLYLFNLQTGEHSVLETGPATANNNDHVLSWDGSRIAISNHVATDNNQSTAFVLPITGSETPTQVTGTGKGHSFLHGFSPDDTHLVFTGERGGQPDIWRVNLETGVETQLTNEKSLDDGSEYSPDGQHIYFNSVRTGTMELWRMKADGTEQTQLTDDEYNNWFPHVSPDGKQIVFLSFMSDIDPATHPFYRQVYLRRMPIEGGKPTVVAYVYGGQGTINVPSWSPDGKYVAFVSNTVHEQEPAPEQ